MKLLSDNVSLGLITLCSYYILFLLPLSTLLGSMLWNYEALGKLQLFGLPLLIIIIWIIGLVVFKAQFPPTSPLGQLGISTFLALA